MTVAFQGVPGSHSEQAVRQHFGDEVTLLAQPRFADLFDVLEESLAQHAVLPVENTYAGGVLSAYDLLLENNLHIQGEVILRVHHALLARPGVKLDDLRYVRSHPQALEQCEQFLRRYGLEGVPHFNTAGSARDLTREAWQATGVIASARARAAELYGLEVLAPNIEDSPHNYTRFFVVGTTHAPRSRYNKTSIVFATRHEPAALYDCLGELATRGINFTKVESRPRRNRPWEPIFFVDFEGHWSDDNCQRALVGLLQRAAFAKLLGSYPGARGELVGL
ncbi:MAG: prephenate dehydratase [Chloroflexi bacterium]|nr:prephenate dehydratase [Chloroflexota bacterium]